MTSPKAVHQAHGWVLDEVAPGRYQGHLAVYVKHRGMLGRAYLLLIQPFRRVIVYPTLLRQVERTWKEAG